MFPQTFSPSKLLIIAFLSCACAVFSRLEAQVSIREYRQTFPTYPFSDPDPVPKPGKLYPYFRYDGFTDRAAPQEWTVVELENEWLRVMILLEIGGKIWAAIEKSTGKPFIYYNHVVKFRDVAMRGPWTSGGIESNYGIFGHTPACAVPVNYATRRNPDGSASCLIGTLDLLTRTRWTLDIQLPPDKAYFTTNSFWHNSTALEQPYYTWMNVGIKAAGNLEFTYPGTRYLGHDGETGPWRIDEKGRDLAWYNQNNFGSYKSYHVFGRYTSFFGGYWHDEDFGMGRYATRDDKPGKKIWIWGLSRQGMIWEKLLTDTDGQYVEVQSGRLFTQSAPGSVGSPFKYRHFAPHTTDTWTEYWFPVLRTGGVVEANDWGALNVRIQGNQAEFAFCPLQRLNDTLRIFENGRLLLAKPLRLDPLQTVRVATAFSGKKDQLSAILGDQRLVWVADPQTTELHRPVESPVDLNQKSAYAVYLRAKACADQRFYDQALALYEQVLQQEPYFIPALNGKAMLLYRLQRYAESAKFAATALSVDTYDAEANYLWGLSNLALGKIADAKDGFELATPSPAYRTAAFTELAKQYFREHNWSRARAYTEKARESDVYNVEAWQLMVLLGRREDQLGMSGFYLDVIDEHDPLSLFYAFEKHVFMTERAGISPDPEVLRGVCRDELPHENYLELATWYLNLGCEQEGVRVLELAPEHPEKHYLLGAWMARTGDRTRAGQHWEKALAAPPTLVFPFRAECRPALEAALAYKTHWKTRYYLSLLAFNNLDTLHAMRYLKECGNEPDFAPFYIFRAQQLQHTDPAAAEQDLLRARALAPADWRAALYLTRFYATLKQGAKALAQAQSAFAAFPANYILGMECAQALLREGRHNDCLALLDTLNVIPYEGATDARGLYRSACLLSALSALNRNQPTEALQLVEKSKLWPEHLGVGQPYPEEIDLRMEAYIAALACEKQGDKVASARWLETASQAGKEGSNSAEYAAILALRRMGKVSEAARRLDQWLKTRPDDAQARWVKKWLGKSGLPAAQQEADRLKGENALLYKYLK